MQRGVICFENHSPLLHTQNIFSSHAQLQHLEFEYCRLDFFTQNTSAIYCGYRCTMCKRMQTQRLQSTESTMHRPSVSGLVSLKTLFMSFQFSTSPLNPIVFTGKDYKCFAFCYDNKIVMIKPCAQGHCHDELEKLLQ